MEVTINMEEVPRAGTTALILRIRLEDLPDIQKAMKKTKLKQSEFLRTAVINAARQLIAEK